MTIESSETFYWADNIKSAFFFARVLLWSGWSVGFFPFEFKFMFLHFGLIETCVSTFVGSAQLLNASNTREDVMTLSAYLVFCYVCIAGRFVCFMTDSAHSLMEETATVTHGRRLKKTIEM